LETVIRNNADNTERIVRNTLGYVVSNNTLGITAYSTFDNTASAAIVRLIANTLVYSARSAVRDIDTSNELMFLRIATKKFEYLIAPEKEFTIIVLQ